MQDCELPAPSPTEASGSSFTLSALGQIFSVSSVQVMKSLEDGCRLPPPVDCPSILYELMKSCWSQNRLRRPHFQEIRAQLQHFISSPQLLRPVADFDPR